jgi:hypothetical protein
MKLTPAIVLGLSLVSATWAQEGTAKLPDFTNITPDLAMRLPNCPAGTPLFIANGRLTCGTAANTTRTCPANHLVVGLNPDGSLICTRVPAGCELLPGSIVQGNAPAIHAATPAVMPRSTIKVNTSDKGARPQRAVMPRSSDNTSSKKTSVGDYGNRY